MFCQKKVATKVCYSIIYWFSDSCKIGNKRNMVANFSDENKKKKKKEQRTEKEKREERLLNSELVLQLDKFSTIIFLPTLENDRF